jgi:hypothetical protein
LTRFSCRASAEQLWIGCIETPAGAGQILFEPECSGEDSAIGRSNGKKSPSFVQTLFGKGGMQLRRPSANSGSHPKAQVKIAGRNTEKIFSEIVGSS